MYSDPQTVAWEQLASWEFRRQVAWLRANGAHIDLPWRNIRVVASIRLNFDRPKSVPKSIMYPMQSRSDVDNLAKSAMDALQSAGIMWNDNQVTDLLAIKRFSDEDHPEGAEITVTAIRY